MRTRINHACSQTVTGLTATGSSQATALPLAGTNSLQEVVTTAPGTGVLLPVIRIGASVTIANYGASTLAVYPQIGGTINNGTVNASVSIATDTVQTFAASSLTNWYMVSSSAGVGGGGSGTVTSVDFVGDGVVLSSTPSAAVTASGPLTATILVQANNLVLAGPASGANAAPTFRALVGADLPAIGLTITQANQTPSSPADAPTITFDLSAATLFTPAALGGNRALTLTNVPSSTPFAKPFSVILLQDGTGSRTITSWFTGFTIIWNAGSAPTLATAAGARDTIIFTQIGATTFIGYHTASAGGAGTVTTASVASANGFAGTVATATTTPAITISTSITGILKGNGTAVSAAKSGTDYYAPGGTIAATDLPAPSATTLGGVQSIAAVAHNFLTAISTSGVPAHAQPAFTDISGTATAAQLPSVGLELDSFASVITADTDGATITFNLATSNWHSVTLGGNRTLALSNVTLNQQFNIVLVQDGTGKRTVTWFTTIKWAGGTAPTLTTTAGKTDVFTFKQTSTGKYLGSVVGQNF